MNLFKRKQKLEHSDLINLIKFSDELIENVKDAYPLNGNDFSNNINQAVMYARINQINIYKNCFEKLIEEYFKRETPLYWQLKQAYKQLKITK
jgi:hypothetical protein